MSVVNKVVVKNVAYDIEDANTKQALSVEVARAQAKEQELEEELEKVQNRLSTTESVTEVSWGASSNMNSFTTAGVYNIKGERTNANDNLPISNSNPGHTISGRLIVLDSSINGTGDSQDKCITQLLTLSNRTGGDGNTYIRTASGASLSSLTWKSWATQQTNVNVGQVTSLDSFIDNGIYSGVLVENGVPSTFVMIVINDYFVGVSPRRVSQFLYKLSKTGEVSYTTRLGVGDGTITWNGWEIINKKELDATAKELLKRIQGTSNNSSASNDPFKRYPTNFSSVADAEFMEALNTMHSTDSTSGVEGFWRLYIGRLAVEVKNVAIEYVDDTWVQTIKLPYKWYKSSNKFGIDDDGNHHIHTYYRIHKDGSWGDWIEVEEELKSAITAEENRAKAEESAIRKLITDLIGESPETLDSIHEISSWILNDKTGAAAMATQINLLNNVTEGLAGALGEEINRATGTEEDIKSKALQTNTFTVDSIHSDHVNLYMRTLSGETRIQPIPAATTEYAGVMSAADKVALDTATSRALRALFVAAGAEYNDTGTDKTKTAPWGETVIHKAGYYYLNGLGDITEEQMMDIYKYSFPMLGATDWTNAFREVNVRTNLFYKQYYSAARIKTLTAAFNANKTIEIVDFNNQRSKVVLHDAASWNYAFGSCTKLKRILGVLDINNASSLLGSNCDSLIHVQLYNLNTNLLLFNKSNNINKESVLYAIQNASPTSAITITLHANAYARLAEDADIVAALEAQPLVTLVSA